MFQSLMKALETESKNNDPTSVLVFYGVLMVCSLLFSIVASIFLYNLIALFVHRG